MKSKNYKYILFFISVTIIATISLQIYWNIKNYAENKQRLINDVQIAFDNSIEHYYAEDVKTDFMTFIGNDTIKDSNFVQNIVSDSIFINAITKRKGKVKASKKLVATSTFTEDNSPKTTTVIKINNTGETSKQEINFIDSPKSQSSKATKGKTTEMHGKPFGLGPGKLSEVKVITGKRAMDSISKIQNFTNKILISLTRDSIEFEKISKTLDKELARKDISIQYGMQLLKMDTVFQNYHVNKNSHLPLSTTSNSTFLPPNQKMKLLFSNPVIVILKRSMVEIILSFLLSLSIIGCLFYLLKTINKQKKVDEIKNDLISNITHEFKTPITTVATAIEGIRNFNAVNDTEKTNRYLDISNQQLKKLEIMVEKLLETATLDTNNLLLHKEPTNIVSTIRNLVEKYKVIHPEKNISFHSNMEQLIAGIDPFHFENTLSNLIDNAIKYGGDSIDIHLKYLSPNLEIIVQDNGSGIEKSQREKVFEKFYRIPKGNRHDVKGFGIGLYYSKKIIEKHGGTLELLPNPEWTVFKIRLADV
ncbi:sensor histidine kinase [Flavobacterium lindanitolerans]|jgi:signal transduction histidine kinase|uniref:sensor histidine kinase n=1 Tax=Flavobacterium lindanitolerans TaxID=428988 RepID=UPI0023F05B32|nr:HAMP domain-containing sensor histidine kinase [Flavobacterium lindanitolerans]